MVPQAMRESESVIASLPDDRFLTSDMIGPGDERLKERFKALSGIVIGESGSAPERPAGVHC